MHLHPLKAGRSRDNDDLECSICGLMLNDPTNLLATSMFCDCHKSIDADRLRVSKIEFLTEDEAIMWRLCWKDLYRSERAKQLLKEYADGQDVKG